MDVTWEILEWTRYILATGLLILGFIPAAFLAFLGVAALFYKRPENQDGPQNRTPDGGDSSQKALEAGNHIAVVIPAHNEELLIAGTVRSLFQQDYPSARYDVWVIADNCIDATAEKARAEGARVLERSGNPGKGQALQAAFEKLLQGDWDAVLVIDADSRLHRGTLEALNRNLKNGASAIQIFYGVLNPEASRRTAAMELALASFNGLRPRGKAALGWSCGIFGNGFCLSREVVETVPHGAHSIVEDLEFHAKLLAKGYRVRFLDSVWVKAMMPEVRRDATSQRIRWERGRFQLTRKRLLPLLKDAVRGRPGTFQALSDIAIPPASLILLANLGAWLLGTSAIRFAGLLALGFLVLHYLLATKYYGSFPRTLRVVIYLPWYMIWKTLVVALSYLRYRNLPWVRTRRGAASGSVSVKPPSP